MHGPIELKRRRLTACIWLLAILLATIVPSGAASARAESIVDPSTRGDAADMLPSPSDLGPGWVETAFFSKYGSGSASTMLAWRGSGETSPEGLEKAWIQVVVCSSTAEARRMARLQRFSEDSLVNTPTLGDVSMVWISPDGSLYLELAYSYLWIETILEGDPTSLTVDRAERILELSLERGGLLP